MKWNPEDYAKNSDAQLKWAQELRNNLHLKGNESLLDVGCGDGKITADLARHLPTGRVIGTDSSPEMIDYAQRVYPTAEYPNLSFACIDARHLNFEAEFDSIFSNAALHWVDNHQAFLKGASRALRAGGRLIVSCGGYGNAADILAVMEELVARERWQGYFETFRNPYFFYGTDDYSAWLPAAGFRIQRLELVPKDMTHPGAAGLAGWIRTTWMPFTECVPECEREAFLAEFVERYLARIPLSDRGLACVRMVRLEIEAIRE